MRSAMIGGALAGIMALAIPAVADEVRDSIEEALAAYEKNDLAAAKQPLDYASELIVVNLGRGFDTLHICDGIESRRLLRPR